MKAKPVGMLWMTPMEWRNPLPGVLWRARKALPEDRLVARMNKLTLLGDAMRDLDGAAAGHGIGGADRWRRLVGLCNPGGERRVLFGVGEGPAEAVAGAKQDRETGVSQRLRKVAEWVKSGSVVTW